MERDRTHNAAVRSGFVRWEDLCARWLGLCLGGWLCAAPAAAQEVILHLRNGDRIAGRILSEDATNVVVATGWIERLPVPVSAIERREAVRPQGTSAPAQIVAEPALAPAQPASAPSAVQPQKPKPAPTSKPAATTAAPPKRWKAQVSMGTDLQFGARDRELFYGRAKLTYELPYAQNPRRFFRSIADYSVDYGRTDGNRSTDRMFGSLKTDFDVGERIFVYNLLGAGYDAVRKIDFQYEVGPGAGYRLFQKPEFAMNLEAGANYQSQERSDSPSLRKVYLRLAEDVTWKLHSRVTLIEKLEWLSNIEDPGQFQLRFESSVSFGLWQNLALKLSVQDLYDTRPARGVNRNEVLLRSSLELTF